ncbi:MAG: hypothetical protein H7256_06410, partial [Bdellovibrio sp.]|nr:hypothetical protein [Bdellovibrio sp.]
MKTYQILVVKVVSYLAVLALMQSCAKPTDSGLLTGVHTDNTKAQETDQQVLERIQKEQARQNPIPANSISEKMTRVKTADDKKEENKTVVVLPAVPTTPAPVAKAAENKVEACVNYTNLKLEKVDYIGVKSPEQIKIEQSKRIASKDKKDKTDIAKNAISKDTESIKASKNTYLTFKDLVGLNKISDSAAVVFRTKIAEEKSALPLLARSNENTYCRIEGASSFAAGDALTFSSQAKMLISKSFDIYEDRLEFVNANGNLSLICTHTTVGLFIEEVAKNLAAYITLTTDNVAINGSQFVNPFTQTRMLNAFQILDVAKMNQITMSANPNDVLTTENKSICKVTQKMGQYDLNKTYFKVATGPLVKSADGQTRIESSVYQADKNNFFVMACQFSAEVNS